MQEVFEGLPMDLVGFNCCGGVGLAVVSVRGVGRIMDVLAVADRDDRDSGQSDCPCCGG